MTFRSLVCRVYSIPAYRSIRNMVLGENQFYVSIQLTVFKYDDHMSVKYMLTYPLRIPRTRFIIKNAQNITRGTK